MRFTNKQVLLKEAYIKNTIISKQKFLWLPITINGETRWLEKAHIKYKVTLIPSYTIENSYYWEAIEFVNK